MSGAGRSVARKTLEDIGCEAIDNLPLALVPILVAPAADAPAIGLGIDARTRGFGIAAMPETLGAVDLGFDVRFLANPHYIARSRPLCGLDPPVAAHIAEDAEFKPFFDRLWQLLRPLLPRYEQEGKAYLTIAIGCTGGRHRSVAIAEHLAARYRERDDLVVEVVHRDVDRFAG
jgi:RNase adaptor protein for sRNA GlmZ degradation